MREHAYVKARFARDAQRGPLENTRLQPLAEPCNVTPCNVTGLSAVIRLYPFREFISALADENSQNWYRHFRGAISTNDLIERLALCSE